jgi:tRNA dimethylallyltransferase
MQGKVHIICGPTASGKSAAAIERAKAEGGVIINADSQQVYRDLPILTAAPSAKDMAEVPHRLYGLLAGDAKIDAFKWSELAAAEVRAAWAAGKAPYVVGGTGFYIKALTEGLSVMPSIPPKIRELVRKEFRDAKLDDMAAVLKKYDPELVSKVSRRDRQRILRGIETFRATGIPLSAWQRNRKIRPLEGAEFEFTFIDLPISELEERIKIRTESMVAGGLVEEMDRTLAIGYGGDASIFKVIGAQAVRDYIDAKATLPKMKAAIVLATRQYAKRQRTFFRTQFKAAAG